MFLERGYRTEWHMSVYNCLPFPPWQMMRIAATRQDFPYGALARGLDGARPRCSKTLFPDKREWQARFRPMSTPSPENEDAF